MFDFTRLHNDVGTVSIRGARVELQTSGLNKYAWFLPGARHCKNAIYLQNDRAMRWPDCIQCLFLLWIMLCHGPIAASASGQEISARDEAGLRAALIDYFVAPLEKQEKWKFSPQFERLL